MESTVALIIEFFFDGQVLLFKSIEERSWKSSRGIAISLLRSGDDDALEFVVDDIHVVREKADWNMANTLTAKVYIMLQNKVW